MAGYYRQKLDRLDSGEPVVFAGWELPMPLRRPGDADEWFVLDPDGALLEVEPVHPKPNEIRFRRPDGSWTHERKAV